MEAAKKKLRDLLENLFQFDCADLDFGVYRILNLRRDEFRRFLNDDLLPQVENELRGIAGTDRAALERQLQEIEASVKAMGIGDPTTVPKWKEIRAQLDSAPDVKALAKEVFSDLATFFSRYYDEGDFMARPRYNERLYAIPYDGSEVKLHWVNADQHFVKTMEFFLNYEAQVGNRTLRFVLSEAIEERDNSKAVEKRRFFLANEHPVVVEGTVLTARFVYGAHPSGGKQDALCQDAEARILRAVPADWRALLSRERTESRSELGFQLWRYTKRNTSDYFIHRNLGPFLRRELDFFIKNEILHLDDIEGKSGGEFELTLRRVRALRGVAIKIIDWLAQIENFQLRLFEKRRLVASTDWLVTLDNVPESLLEAVASNRDQTDAWRDLFAIHKLPKDLINGASVDARFLKANRGLVLDTRHFDLTFKANLLAAISARAAKPSGVLVQGDGLQALRLLGRTFAGASAVYIDPPYNTGDGDFPYKDAYQHSSWLAMMAPRLLASRALLAPTGSLVVHIDEHEHDRLAILLEQSFGAENVIGPVVWDKRNPKGDSAGIAAQHEYLAWAVRDAASLKSLPDGGLTRAKENGARMLAKAAEFISQHRGVNAKARAAFKEWLRDQPFSGGELAYSHLDDDGDVYRPVSMAWPNKQKAPPEYFRPLVHPDTGKECPVPGRGWRNPPDTMDSLLARGLILFGEDETTQPNRKYLLKENLRENVPSIYYFGGSDDELQANMGYEFPNPKPVKACAYVCGIVVPKDGVVVDHFAGSGSVGHAVIQLNREDGGTRSFLLVEMGDHFDTVLVPRIMKATYSAQWKERAPVDRKGVSAVYKVIRLESYDDTLENVQLRGDQRRNPLFGTSPSLNEDYVLRYQLDLESKGSLLDLARFRTPFDYRFKVRRAGVVRDEPVDLVETFNYLLGLQVTHYGILGKDPLEARWVEGTLGKGGREKALVIWRDCDKVSDEELNKRFRRADFRLADFDVIFVNGDNRLENERRGEDHWKVVLIEEEFHARMFAEEG